jgi:ferredoxin
MEESLLTDELVKRCNPGLTDFGSGTILALSGQCLRSAKRPSDCQVCVDACPVGALSAEAGSKPRVNTECLRCGLCIGVCPLHSLAATTRTIQQIIRTLLQATLRVDDLAITCQRSLSMLRLAAMSSDPAAALAGLGLASQAQSTESLFVVPCLAMLPREIWFVALNEVGQARVKRLYVWAPVGQCGQCPVDADGQAEAVFTAAIDTAERWSGQRVGILSLAEELPQYRTADVRRYLASGERLDRRGIFTGLADELKRSYDDSTRVGNRGADETLKNRERKAAVERTLLANDLRAGVSGKDKQVVSPFRQALVEAIGRNPGNAGRVELLVSQTDALRCEGCGACVDVCPVGARRLKGPDGPAAADGLPVDTVSHAVSAAVGQQGDPPGLADGKARIAYVDPLYCLGCSACLQACEAEACSFMLISGEAFLR